MGKKNYAYVNKEMLVWARSITPFESTSDVQERIKIDASKIDGWERGEDLPSINEAKKLAALYKVPFAAFFLSEPPKVETRPYTDRRTYSGTVYRETSYELWSEIGRIIGNRDKMLEYAGEDDYCNTLPVLDNTVSAKDIADVMRNYLGLELPFRNKSAYKSAYGYYRNVFETHGIMVAQVTGVCLEEMKGVSIYYDRFPIVAVNSKDFNRAKAFSLFHELAHLVRRSSSLCLIDFDDRNDDEEKLCDRIAAEIMMPEKEFLDVVDESGIIYHEWSAECLNNIADKFAVSTLSVIRRLYELNRVTNSEYQKVYKDFKDDFSAKMEQIEASKENKSLIVPYYLKYLNKEGFLFAKIIMSSYSKGEISYGEMCQILNISRMHIDKIERAVMFI